MHEMNKTKTAVNLKRILEYLDISSAGLAKEINVDASLISRWLNGRRPLRQSSVILDNLTDYLLDKILRTNNRDWLKRQLELDGAPPDGEWSDRLDQGLKVWLASDGEWLRGKDSVAVQPTATEIGNLTGAGVKTGHIEISQFIEKALDRLPDDAHIDIHVSNEETVTLLHESISRMLLAAMLERKIPIRFLISLTSNTLAMSRILRRYLQAIIEGFLSVSVVHGMTQTITNQTTFIMEKKWVLIVCETPKSIAPPLGTTTTEESFIKESQKSFDRAYNYSQGLLQRYNDNYSRNILEILFHEFALPGNLDIIKDNINPMYMTLEAYDAFLKKCGHKGEQFKWRSAEFVRFKSGLDENMRSGTVFREVLSLSRLK